jgi:23S rRNA (uracil1939-C5)-methyltransferase
MKKQNTLSVPILIERLSSKGFGVGLAKKNEHSLPAKAAIPGCMPGDQIIAEIGAKRKGAYFGKLLEVSLPSPDRRTPPCAHAATCGGCSLQSMRYEKQLSYKENLVKELFAPIFSGTIEPIVPSSLEWRYRNKMEYSFSQNKAGEKFLGLMIAGSKGRVQTLFECHLCPDFFTKVLQSVKKWWEEEDLFAFNGFQDTGSLRTLTVREGARTGQKMVILTVSGNPLYALKKAELDRFVLAVKKALEPYEEGSLSIFLRIWQAIKGQPTQFYEMNLFGPDHIQEELKICVKGREKSYRFKVSPTAFFQPNTLQAEKLYAKALEMAGSSPKKLIFDLYAGTATLGMIFASFAEKVLAVELNPYAVFDAEVNKEINQVSNIEIIRGDVAAVLTERKDNRPDLVILDPPRTGLSPQALEVVVAALPREILYISCAPSQQVRDCKLLLEAGYEIVQVAPFDQFPHTVHIENIALLRRIR